MDIQLTKHGYYRVKERSCISVGELKKIANKGHYVRIGHDIHKPKLTHWLIFSKRDNEHLILVVDEAKSEIVTALFAETFKNWMIDPELFRCVEIGDFQLRTLRKPQANQEAWHRTQKRKERRQRQANKKDSTATELTPVSSMSLYSFLVNVFTPAWTQTHASEFIFDASNETIKAVIQKTGYQARNIDLKRIRKAYIFRNHTVSFERLVRLIEYNKKEWPHSQKSFKQFIQDIGFGRINNQQLLWQKFNLYRLGYDTGCNCGIEFMFKNGGRELHHFNKETLIMKRVNKDQHIISFMNNCIQSFSDDKFVKKATFYHFKNTTKGRDVFIKELSLKR